MKQAYLITAYKDAGSLHELAQLFAKTGYVYIHVDAKSKTITDDDVEQLNHVKNCVAVRKYDIKWGGFNHVKALLELMMMAVANHDVSFMHFLTGEDYPLIPVEELDRLFVDDDSIYMSYITPENLPESVAVRYRYYNWFQDRNIKNKFLWSLQDLTVRLQKMCGVFRDGIGEFNRIYKGLVYISLPKDAAAYVIEYIASHEEFWEDLYKCQVPEEFLFQTLFMNSTKWSQHVVDRELRYMDWSRGDGSGPCYLESEDYEKIKSGEYVFARKFHPEISGELRERIRKELLDL